MVGKETPMINGNRTKSERKRSPRDFYQTPVDLAVSALSALHEDENTPISYNSRWLDAGCGAGVWGRALDNAVRYIHGIDIQPCMTDVTRTYYSSVVTGDFLEYDRYGFNAFDMVFGNPPYSLAEEFVRHSYKLIGLNGYVFFLLRLSFLEGIKRCHGLYQDIPLKRVYVCARRPSFFSSDGKRNTTDTLAYGMFLWQKGYRGKPSISFLDWDYS
jgi:hypothetical protein